MLNNSAMIISRSFIKLNSRDNKSFHKGFAMKFNSIIFAAVVTSSALTMTTTHAGNTTNTALTSALGGVVGAAGG